MSIDSDPEIAEFAGASDAGRSNRGLAHVGAAIRRWGLVVFLILIVLYSFGRLLTIQQKHHLGFSVTKDLQINPDSYATEYSWRVGYWAACHQVVKVNGVPVRNLREYNRRLRESRSHVTRLDLSSVGPSGQEWALIWVEQSDRPRRSRRASATTSSLLAAER